MIFRNPGLSSSALAEKSPANKWPAKPPLCQVPPHTGKAGMWLTLLLRNSAPHTALITVCLALRPSTSWSGLLAAETFPALLSAKGLNPFLLCIRRGQEQYLGDLKGGNKRYDSVLLDWKDSCLKARNCVDKTTHLGEPLWHHFHYGFLLLKGALENVITQGLWCFLMS